MRHDKKRNLVRALCTDACCARCCRMGTPRGRPSQHQQTRTIEELASAARGGDTAAFHDLYVQLSPSLTRLAARILRDDAEAVAAADDALLSGVQRWNGGTNFTSWIYRRTQWTAITALRRRARAPEPTDDEIIDLRAADDVESEVLLRSVIESLDAAELVCASILFSGGSSREVADTLRVHRNTVRTIKQRLLTKLNLKGGGDQ